MRSQPTFTPTEQQLAEACDKIRRTWSDAEYRRRSTASTDNYHVAGPDIRTQAWRPPTIALASLPTAMSKYAS